MLFYLEVISLICSQPIQSTTFHMYLTKDISYCFVYSQKPVCLYKCRFTYICTYSFSDIYCSSQKPEKVSSFFLLCVGLGLSVAMGVLEYILFGVQDTKQS